MKKGIVILTVILLFLCNTKGQNPIPSFPRIFGNGYKLVKYWDFGSGDSIKNIVDMKSKKGIDMIGP